MTDTASHDISKRPGVWQKLSAWFDSASPFQRSFVEGLGAVLAVAILLLLWMMFRAESTAEKIQTQFPAEAVEILRPGAIPHTAIPDDAAALLTEKEEQHAADLQSPSEQQEAIEPELNNKVSAALPAAPIEGLFEQKDNLVLPKIHLSADGDITPFESYKRPFTPVEGRPLVALVVLDLGLSSSISDEIIKGLPADVTFALSPYAQDGAGWSGKMRATGHEVWLSLPMQTKDGKTDSGPHAISVNASLQDNQNNLWSTLGSTVGYAGVVSQHNHAFTGNDIDVEPILKQIYGRGLAFAESNTDASGFAETMAKTNRSPYIRNDLWIGTDFQSGSLERSFQDVERMAARNGQVVAFILPYPAALEKTALWIAELEERGLQLAPLSALIKPH